MVEHGVLSCQNKKRKSILYNYCVYAIIHVHVRDMLTEEEQEEEDTTNNNKHVARKTGGLPENVLVLPEYQRLKNLRGCHHPTPPPPPPLLLYAYVQYNDTRRLCPLYYWSMLLTHSVPRSAPTGRL